jgi:hypothetical protein
MRKAGCCAWTSPEIFGEAERAVVAVVVVFVIMAMTACRGTPSSFHEMPVPRRLFLTFVVSGSAVKNTSGYDDPYNGLRTSSVTGHQRHGTV